MLMNDLHIDVAEDGRITFLEASDRVAAQEYCEALEASSSSIQRANSRIESILNRIATREQELTRLTDQLKDLEKS